MLVMSCLPANAQGQHKWQAGSYHLAVSNIFLFTLADRFKNPKILKWNAAGIASTPACQYAGHTAMAGRREILQTNAVPPAMIP
jgi:hypothetical protein